MGISSDTERLLWAGSGGYCQNPACNHSLFVFFGNGEITSLHDLAHIISKSKKGPRGKSDLNAKERDEYENLILLCPKCHRLIDKKPEQYPAETLYDWKHHHEDVIQHAFAEPVYSSREKLACVIQKLLRINRAVFLQFGPHSEYSIQPLSDAADVWRRRVLDDIIPNNRRIAHLLTRNEHLLSKEEAKVLDKFILHQKEFEYNHISRDKNSAAPLFPVEMNNMLQE